LLDMTLRLRVMVPDESKEPIAFVFKGQEVIKCVLLGLVVHLARMGLKRIASRSRNET